MTLLGIRMLRRNNKAVLKSLQIYLNFTQFELGLGINNLWKIALNFCIFLLFLLIICGASGQNIEKVFIIIVIIKFLEVS